MTVVLIVSVVLITVMLMNASTRYDDIDEIEKNIKTIIIIIIKS